MRTFALILAALLVSVSAAGEIAKQRFLYGRWLRDDLIEIVPPSRGEQGRIWVAKDAVDNAMFCPNDSQFVCFYSNYYAIAIPKSIGDDQSSWEHQGVVYEVVRRGVTVSVFGETVSDLLLIRVPSSATPGMRSTGEQGYFLYSRERGVVGMGFWKDSDTGERIYWLKGKKGFGATD
jgi:hypothetical protein